MKKQLLLLASLFITSVLFATHNYAGEITYRQTGPTEVEAFVITYTVASSIPADRDSLYICWGDGTCDQISRENGPNNEGELIADNIKKNIYPAAHTYAGMGTYTITMDDPNRNGGILNVDFPNSETSVFMLAAKLTLFNPAFNDPVQSPVFLQAPVDNAFTLEPFMHAPNAFSLSGDSISYELITPIGVTDYSPVTEINPGPNNTLSLDEETGLLVWDAPQADGLYVITYQVRFYRDGEEIGWIIRDMMIDVEEGPGLAPEITFENITGNSEILEVALGDTVRLNMTFSDPDESQELQISATSGLFELQDSPADFTASSSNNTGTGLFEWIVTEEHLRAEAYQLVVRVEDNTPDRHKSAMRVIRYQTEFTTDTEDLIPLPKISIFPNPVKATYLNIDYAEMTPGKYVIFNALGQSVQQGVINTNTNQVNIAGLSNGTYFLSLKIDDRELTSLFIVQ